MNDPFLGDAGDLQAEVDRRLSPALDPLLSDYKAREAKRRIIEFIADALILENDAHAEPDTTVAI